MTKIFESSKIQIYLSHSAADTVLIHHGHDMTQLMNSLGHIVAFLLLLLFIGPTQNISKQCKKPKMKRLTKSEIMQSERSISLLNLFHQKSLKWIYQSPLPTSIPQNGGYHFPKRLFLSIHGVWRGWNLKKDQCQIKSK